MTSTSLAIAVPRAPPPCPGTYFDLVIVLISGMITVDFMAIDLRSPDLSSSDAPEQLLRSGYTINYTMQRASATGARSGGDVPVSDGVGDAGAAPERISASERRSGTSQNSVKSSKV